MTVCAACDRAIHPPDDTHTWHHPHCPNIGSDIDWNCCDRTSSYHPDCCPRPDCQPDSFHTKPRMMQSIWPAPAEGRTVPMEDIHDGFGGDPAAEEQHRGQ